MDTLTETRVPTDTPTETSFFTPTLTMTVALSPASTLSPTPTRTPGELPPDLTISLPGGVTMEFVLCPPGGGPGSFQMGSNDGPGWSWCHEDRGYSGCEKPVHAVMFAQPFYMGKYEVTQNQWQAIMGSNPSYNQSCGGECPVELVDWYDCQTFIASLNAHIADTGQGPATFRLPSEAEWEYACRAGTTTRFSFGDSTCSPGWVCVPCDLSNYAWWCANCGPHGSPTDGAKPVGEKLPNPWGLYDMHGNVYEWCQDWWNESYDGAPTDGLAWTQGDNEYRVIRGGYWSALAHYCRSSSRVGLVPTLTFFSIGLRLTRSVAP